MIYVSEIYQTAPKEYETSLQKEVYKTLEQLQIPFERVHTDEVITMEDCASINAKMKMKMVKTLFLTNRRKTQWYLFITCGEKAFRSKEVSSVLGVPRLSFAPADQMEALLETQIGAATVFSALVDREHKVRVIFDRDVLAEQWYGCSDGTTTGYLKVETEKIVKDFLAYAKHTPTIVEV